MKITLGTQTFDTVKGLLHYLESYEQDNAGKEREVSLAWESFAPEYLSELTEFLSSPQRSCLYRIKLQEEENSQIALDNAYLIAKRRHAVRPLRQHLAQMVSLPVVFYPLASQIRKAKKNWIDGTTGARIGLQIQPPNLQKKNSLIAKAQHQEVLNLFNLKSDGSPTEVILGSWQQFAKGLLPDEQCEQNFNYLFASDSLLEQRKESLLFFLQELERDSATMNLLQKLLDSLPLSSTHYQGLAYVLLHLGAAGVLLLLRQFQILQEHALFADFNQLFLNEPHKYLDLLTEEGLENLKKFIGLTREQKIWWHTLVKQHHATGTATHFNELFTAFTSFITELDKRNIKLPWSFALEPALFVIIHSAAPQEQWANLRHHLPQDVTFTLNQLMQLKSFNELEAEEATAFLTAMLEVGETADALPKVEDSLFEAFIAKTTALIAAKADFLPQLFPVLTLLMQTCSKGNTKQLNRLNRYLGLIEKMEQCEESVLDNWLKILAALGTQAKNEELHLLLDVLENLEVHQFYLEELTRLFEYPPYPKLPDFTAVLAGYAKGVKGFIEQFDKDPKSGRVGQYDALGRPLKTVPQIINEQGDTSQIQRVLEELRDGQDSPLSSQEQYELAQQITYINAVGKHFPLVINEAKSGEPPCFKTYADLTSLTRVQLRHISDFLIARLRTPHLAEAEKLRLQLKLLAALREQYFRATGSYAHTTQILTVLLSLKKQSHDLFLEIEDQEGKGVTTALLAVMQWVDANGGTVDVCAKNKGLLVQDYLQKGTKDFFSFLGIPSSHVEAHSGAKTYQVGGINYSTIGDLALYRARAQRDNEVLLCEENGRILPCHLIFDKSGFFSLDDRTLFDFSIGAESDEPDKESPYAWVYPLINEFINSSLFKNIHPPTGWSEEDDVSQLKEFLDKQAPSGAHKACLSALPYSKFNQWINSAIAAQRLVEADDFDVPETDSAVHVAVPYSLEGFSFSKGVQQFLHARLQKEYSDKGWVFPIQPEMDDVSSLSVNDLISIYKEQGRIIGLSNILGTKSELLEQCDKFNVEATFKLPSHVPNTRQELSLHPVHNHLEYLKEIKSALSKAQNGQPIILIAPDADAVKYLEAQLKKYNKSAVIGTITGKESVQERQKWLKEQAGKPGAITIATSLLACEIDLDTKHSQGFLAIQTDLDSRNTRQMMRKLGRNGKPGQYIIIYDEHGLFFSQHWFYSSQKQHQDILGEIAALQKKRSEAVAVARYFTQTVAGIERVFLKQFDEWQAFLNLLYPHQDQWSLHKDLLAQRDELLCLLEEKWQECLQSSDPAKIYPNPFHRRDSEGRLLIEDLYQVLQQFEQQAERLWNEQCNFWQAKAREKIEPGSLNELRCDYLTKISFREQLQLNELITRKNKKESWAQRKKTKRHVTAALDPNGAMLRYSEGDCKAYRQAFIQSQTQLLKQDISLIVKNHLFLSKFIRKNLLEQIQNAFRIEELVLFLNDYALRWLPDDHFEKKYVLQPIIQELLHVYEQGGLDETKELLQLKSLYLDNALFEIVDNLEHTLSWAVKGQRGLGYLLERSAVKKAASDILALTSRLPTIQPEKRFEYIRALYKVLMQHQMHLENLWIFSLGHKNTRDLIKQTLATLDSLSFMGGTWEVLDADFIRECKENAIYHTLQTRFHQVLTTVEQDKRLHGQDKKEWQRIKSSLEEMQQMGGHLYIFHEMNHFIIKEMGRASSSRTPLMDALARLRGELRMIAHECSLKHQPLMDESNYFSLKAEQIKEHFNDLPEVSIANVTIKAEHNGFNDFIDVIIECQGQHALLKGFIDSSSQLAELKSKMAPISMQLQEHRQSLLHLSQLEYQLSASGWQNIDLQQVPEHWREQVKVLRQLKSWMEGEHPDDAGNFSESLNVHFHDRVLLSTVDFENLDVSILQQVQDPQLKKQLLTLEGKIKEAAKPRSFVYRGFNYVSNFVAAQEKEANWRTQFAVLKKQPQMHLETEIKALIGEQKTILLTEIRQLQQDLQHQEAILQEKYLFLSQKITEEESCSGLYSKRFKNMDELFEFEEQLKLQQQISLDLESSYASCDSHAFSEIEDEELLYSLGSSGSFYY